MDPMEFFNVMGNMLATGPLTPADIILWLGVWAALGVLILAMSSAITHFPVVRLKAVVESHIRRARVKKAA